MNTTVNDLLQSAAHMPFISYDDEFLDILGPSPSIKLVQERESNFAAEAGVWIKGRNEVWYTTWINDGPTHVEILNLRDNTIKNLTSSEPLKNPNGGHFHQGRVYFTCLRDDSRNWPGGVVSVNPENGHVETVLNSYFGLKFDSIDDLAWVTQPGTNYSYLFMTILPLTKGVATSEERLPQGLWRFDPQRGTLLPVISRTELPMANGVCPSKDQQTLWVTDFGGEHNSGAWGLPAEVGSPAIYKYDLNANMLPTNRKFLEWPE
ncbi:lactonohydrolase [Penicillium canescens]|nr:lactonohydrolase [Penicillium canescens]KAJ6068977.1 lactonohydrolase [Penicillium canescens]KAJ6182967.1 lactonohydrolase [Penicillium canescens]